jgi:hypothetical protein
MSEAPSAILAINDTLGRVSPREALVSRKRSLSRVYNVAAARMACRHPHST